MISFLEQLMNTARMIFAVLFLVSLAGISLVFADEHKGLPHSFEAGWKGEDVCEVVFENDEVVIGKCVFPPGVGHEKHYHKPHFGYILEGTTFRVTDEKGVRDLETPSGVTWSNDEVSVHEALNVGDTTGSALIVEFKQ